MQNRNKKATSLRLSPLAFKILDTLKELKGASATALIEEAIRLLAKREGVDIAALLRELKS